MNGSTSFEESMKRLEEIVRELEEGDIEIEKALLIFEEGTKLSRLCAKKLAKVERRIEILTKGKDGEENLELFRDLDAE